MLLDAGNAPAGPEIHDHRAAPQSIELKRAAAFQVLEPDIGCRLVDEGRPYGARIPAEVQQQESDERSGDGKTDGEHALVHGIRFRFSKCYASVSARSRPEARASLPPFAPRASRRRGP